MSWGLITGGGTDGRYTIELDYGEATKAAILANLATAQSNLAAKRVEQQTIVDECDASEQAALENLILFQEALTAEMAANNGEVDSSAMQLYTDLLGRYRRLQAQHIPARQALVTIKAQQAECNREIVKYNNAVTSETKSAWCCDLTEDATGYVATVDIPGETNLMLIAPGGRAWTSADGVFTARDIMSPAQAYFNAAILPGWQKFMPTYRWATIDQINDDGTVNITFGQATSSAQRLDVNGTDSLDNVPVTYMTCGASAFADGDRCVVQFVASSVGGQDVWNAESCRVIGFLDNPKRCGNLIFTRLDVQASTTPLLGTFSICTYGGYVNDSALISSILSAGSASTCDYRINSGGWGSVPYVSPGAWRSEEASGSANVVEIFVVLTASNISIQITDFHGFVSHLDYVELRVVLSSSVVINCVVRVVVPDQSTTEISRTGNPETSLFVNYGGMTGFAYSRTQIAVSVDSPNTIVAIQDYTLVIDE